MSYQRYRGRRARALAGVSSRAPRAPLYRDLAGVTSRAPAAPIRRDLAGVPDWYRAMSGAPDWYKAMQGTTLGDDTIGGMTDAQWKAEMLEGQHRLLDAQKHWADGDRFQKWIQIGATLAIPLAAAVWRALGVGRRKST